MLPAERDIFDKLINRASATFAADDEWDRRYEGTYRVPFAGHNLQPWLRSYEASLPWCRRVVDVLAPRVRLRSFYLPGEEIADERLRRVWSANNLESESALVHKDALIYGRAFVSVGSPAREGGVPVVRVESPRELTAIVNPWTQEIDAALRTVAGEDGQARFATLYLPDVTLWLEKDAPRWVERDRDEHALGRVPVVMFLNRRRPGRWGGVSEMADVSDLSDIASRTLMDMQVAMESEVRNQKYALGLKREDFVDKDGNQIDSWTAGSNPVWTNGNKDVKVGVLPGAGLSSFHDTIEMLAKQASASTGFPLRYFGLSTSNPPSGDAIRSDESGIITRAEEIQRDFDAPWGWVAALAHRIATGEWIDGAGVAVEWYDAATPTISARADALVKMRQVGALSREGLWDEFGWSQARKERELAYFEAEASDPTIERITASLMGAADAGTDQGI